MLPGLRRRSTLPSIGSLLLVTAAVSAAIALAPFAVDAGTTAGRAIGQMSSGRSISVDGIEIGVPKPGMGVGASETHPDGSATDIRITTDLGRPRHRDPRRTSRLDGRSGRRLDVERRRPGGDERLQRPQVQPHRLVVARGVPLVVQVQLDAQQPARDGSTSAPSRAS